MDSRIFFWLGNFLLLYFLAGWLIFFFFSYLAPSLSFTVFSIIRDNLFFCSRPNSGSFFLFLLKDSFRFYFVVGPLVHLFSFILIFVFVSKDVFFLLLLLLRYAFLGFFLLFHHFFFFLVSFNHKKALKK